MSSMFLYNSILLEIWLKTSAARFIIAVKQITWTERGDRMELENAAKRCVELGTTTRLSIFRLLVRAGKEGLPVGEIQRNLGVPGSTLSHHIQRLVQVGLVNQRRDSRVLYCEPQFDAVRELADFLVSECCSLQSHIERK